MMDDEVPEEEEVIEEEEQLDDCEAEEDAIEEAGEDADEVEEAAEADDDEDGTSEAKPQSKGRERSGRSKYRQHTGTPPDAGAAPRHKNVYDRSSKGKGRGGGMVMGPASGIEVRARQKLSDGDHVDQLVQEIEEYVQKFRDDDEENISFADLDISQNSVSVEQFEALFLCLGGLGVRVQRFRLFGCPTINDEAVGVLADYLSRCTSDTIPSEIHLSDCAITTDGFNNLMQCLEDNEAFPEKNGDRAFPLYLRLEGNYIDEEVIDDKVKEGSVVTFTKRDSHGKKYSPEAKVKLLLFDEDRKGGKGKDKGKGKDRGKGYRDDRRDDWRSSRDGGRSKGAHSSKGGGRSERNPPWQALPASRARDDRGRGDSWQSSRGGSSSWGSGGTRTATSGGALGRRPRTPPRSAGARAPIRAATSSVRAPARSFAPASRTNGARDNDSRGTPARRDEPPAKRQNTSERPAGQAAGRFSAFGTTRTTSQAKKGGDEKLPVPWEKHYSDEYNIHYYWNSKTGESSWEKPRA